MGNPEHLNIQQQLQRLHGRYHWLNSAVEQTADSVMIADRRVIIEYVQAAFEETAGFSESEAWAGRQASSSPGCTTGSSTKSFGRYSWQANGSVGRI